MPSLLDRSRYGQLKGELEGQKIENRPDHTGLFILGQQTISKLCFYCKFSRNSTTTCFVLDRFAVVFIVVVVVVNAAVVIVIVTAVVVKNQR